MKHKLAMQKIMLEHPVFQMGSMPLLAEDIYKRLILKNEPLSLEVQYGIIEITIDNGNYQEAFELCQEMTECFPNCPDAKVFAAAIEDQLKGLLDAVPQGASKFRGFQ